MSRFYNVFFDVFFLQELSKKMMKVQRNAIAMCELNLELVKEVSKDAKQQSQESMSQEDDLVMNDDFFAEIDAIVASCISQMYQAKKMEPAKASPVVRKAVTFDTDQNQVFQYQKEASPIIIQRTTGAVSSYHSEDIYDVPEVHNLHHYDEKNDVDNDGSGDGSGGDVGGDGSGDESGGDVGGGGGDSGDGSGDGGGCGGGGGEGSGDGSGGDAGGGVEGSARDVGGSVGGVVDGSGGDKEKSYSKLEKRFYYQFYKRLRPGKSYSPMSPPVLGPPSFELLTSSPPLSTATTSTIDEPTVVVSVAACSTPQVISVAYMLPLVFFFLLFFIILFLIRDSCNVVHVLKFDVQFNLFNSLFSS